VTRVPSAAAARLVNIIVSCIHNAKFFSTNADNDREWILHFVSGVQISLCRKRTTAGYSGEGHNGTSQIQAIFFVNGKSHVKDGFSATNIDNLTDIKLANKDIKASSSTPCLYANILISASTFGLCLTLLLVNSSSNRHRARIVL